MQFTDKTVVLTGSASGIGQALVNRFTERGAKVVGVDRRESQGVDRSVVGDLSTADGVRAICEQITEPVHVLVNNAGVAATAGWRTVLGVNALAPRDMVAGLDDVFAADPVVVTTASQAGLMWQSHYDVLTQFLAIEDWDEALALMGRYPDIENQCYSVSKEAAIAWAGALAVTGKARNMRSNTVSPGPVDTPLLPDFRESMGADAIDLATGFAGRNATADDVAEVICWLASDSARWVNGADIPVDGGLNAMVFKEFLSPMYAGQVTLNDPQ